MRRLTARLNLSLVAWVVLAGVLAGCAPPPKRLTPAEANRHKLEFMLRNASILDLDQVRYIDNLPFSPMTDDAGTLDQYMKRIVETEGQVYFELNYEEIGGRRRVLNRSLEDAYEILLYEDKKRRAGKKKGDTP